MRIDKTWWNHLAPKEILQLRREVQGLLSTTCRSPGGSEWLRAATKMGGNFRVKPGQRIPVFHVIYIRGKPPFVAPSPKLKIGHRAVRTETPLAKGPLQDGELAIEPVIRVEYVDDPVFLEASQMGKCQIDEARIKSPSLIFSCPAHLLLRPSHFPKKSFVLYQHIFGNGGSYPDDGYFYVGVTTRSWQKRWAEHRRAIAAGSALLFHRKFREERDAGRITYVHHRVMGVTDDLEALYGSEEFLVEGHWLDERRLNMIPGGKSGLRYMREHGMLADNVAPMPDDRDAIVSKWLEKHPRKGLPAPWVAEKWKDNDWAVAQICGRDGRLSVEQVRAIRALAASYSADVIASRIGAKDEAQVKRVLEGKTYSRVE